MAGADSGGTCHLFGCLRVDPLRLILDVEKRPVRV